MEQKNLVKLLEAAGLSEVKGKIKKITISAVHIKADGTKKDLGIISETEVKK